MGTLDLGGVQTLYFPISTHLKPNNICISHSNKIISEGKNLQPPIGIKMENYIKL